MLLDPPRRAEANAEANTEANAEDTEVTALVMILWIVEVSWPQEDFLLG